MNNNHMSHTSNMGALNRRALMVATAIVAALAMLMAMASPAKADNRWLRPGCSWSEHGHGIQRCSIWSPANNRNMDVLIQPALWGGNGALYLLDGAQVAPNDANWAHTSVTSIFENDNLTVVMPTGSGGMFYSDSPVPGSTGILPMWETFLTSELPWWLEVNFGVSQNRNSMAGVSMGAVGALNLASRHPDKFRQVHALSGFIDTATGAIPGLRNGGVEVHVWSGNSILGPGQTAAPDIWAPIVGTGGEALVNGSTERFTNTARAQGLGVNRHFGNGVHYWSAWEQYMWDHEGDFLRMVG